MRYRVGIKETSSRVFKALTTIDGLSHWWIASAKGNPKKGGIINFGFSHMKVMNLKSNRLVKWKCVKGPKEWLGTDWLEREEGRPFPYDVNIHVGD